MTLISNTHTTGHGYETGSVPVSRVFVFKDETFLGWDCFYKHSIHIGSHPEADIVLDDPSIADKHAVFYIKGNKIVVSAQSHDFDMRVNHKHVTSSILTPLDYVGIGPYTLKVKMPQMKAPGSLSRKRPAVARILPVKPKGDKKQPPLPVSEVPAPAVAKPGKEKEEAAPENAARATEAKLPATDRQADIDADEDDEMDEAPVQPFLKDALVEAVPLQNKKNGEPRVLEILKSRGSTVIDLKYLAPKEKFAIGTGGGRFCLSAYRSIEACHVFFGKSHSGYLKEPGAADRTLSELCTPERLRLKKKGLYAAALSIGQTFHIEDGDCRYRLRLVPRQASPEVSLPEKTEMPFHKSLIKSCGVHVALMLILSLFLSIPELQGPTEPEAHFVKIDQRQLDKPEPPKVKPQPPRTAVKPQKKKPVSRKKNPPATQKDTPRFAKKAKPASSPKAGGGSGKTGNVKTRNVKETGILGIIGDNIGLAPKAALASVTHMDIVASPGASEKNLNVGGIAGKIPGSKIEIATGDVLRSKGTRQVLMSAGIEGSGEVAALRKGKTGQNQVMAMVSVELDKSVRIQGGMSREAVKRVIDQHLDEISFCYENALMNAPSLMGNIVFEWKILMSGKVGAVRIKSSTVRSSQIHDCIQAAIKSWQFPKPQNSEVMVSYPFVFDIVGF